MRTAAVATASFSSASRETLSSLLLCCFCFFFCLGGTTLAKTFPDKFRLLQLLSDSERATFLGSQTPDTSSVDIVHLPSLSSSRDHLQINLTTHNELLDLHLKRNPHFDHLFANDSSCSFYHGYSSRHSNSLAAVSLCTGLNGYITTPDFTYTIHPVPNHLLQELDITKHEKPHLVLKRESASPDTFCPHALRRKHEWAMSNSSKEQPPLNENEQDGDDKQEDNDRRKRSASNAAIIETALFIDQALYDHMRRTFPADTDSKLKMFVLTLMNAVQRLFQHSSLGKSPDIRLVLLEILKTQPTDLHPSDNIDTYLTNFCIWQHNRRHYGRGKNPRWDHALLLSGINMYVVDESGRRKRHVVGLAPVSGMCNPLNSCTISEGTSFQTVLVAAHEMGHSLGMEHDGFQDGNQCDSDTYVMSPTLGAGKTTWSSCSRQYLDKFLASPQSNCLQTTSFYDTDLLEPPSEKPPGQIYDADYQCSLRYGEGSRRSGLQASEEICRMLRCDTGYGNKGVSFTAHPALEGTSCGRDKWCEGGTCVAMQRSSSSARTRATDGQWSSWSPYSACTSDCVPRGSTPAVGVMVSTRRCDNPRPQNGGRFCLGKDRRVLTCDATRICTVSARKVTLDEFISDTCRQASARDNTIENSGTQFPSQENSHSCYVWCHKRGGGYMTQGWTIPDGTPCWRGHQTQNMYCVKGECQPFDCNGYSTDNVNDMTCSLKAAGSSPALAPSASTPPEVSFSPWHKVSQCRSSCIASGKGFQLVSRECNSLTGCSGPKDTFRVCDAPRSLCGTQKTVEQYAMEVCQRYRIKYPTVLSGKGRQLPAQPGNPHSACIVACQDRVWSDTHYQMDIYEDGKFPFGTDCSFGARSQDYCLNGKCIQFDEDDIPLTIESSHIYEVRRYVSHIKRRDTSGGNHHINNITDNIRMMMKKWYSPYGIHPFVQEKPVLADLHYGWVVEMSECSAVCGGGIKNISVVCQTGRTIVDDGFCANINKPDQTGLWPCNMHACPGRWQEGSWRECSTSCGKGLRSRDVICVQQVTQNIFSMIHPSFCPQPAPLKEEACLGTACNVLMNLV